MGIRGLFSYIQNYVDSSLQWHKLCSCKLVIDGNNLAYELFNNSSGINSAFGGDYDKYATFVEEFFRKLIQCHVEPYVIMDGGHPIKREKFKTVYSRLNAQIYLCQHIDHQKQRFMKIFPLLALSVFVSVVQRLGIIVIQADFEADDEIVVLAKQLNAFVLSNDSDFYLFDVPFILLNTLNFKRVQREERNGKKVFRFIPCYRFDAKKFSEITNVREELFPILAPILGNDFVSPMLLKAFYDEVAFLRPSSRTITFRHKIIISVIKWLSVQKGSPKNVLNKVVRTICGSTSSSKRRCLEAAFFMYFPSQSPLEPWVNPHCPTCPALKGKVATSRSALFSISKINFRRRSFMPPQLLKDLRCTCPDRLKTKIVDGRLLPEWFVRAFRLKLIPSLVADILNKGYMFTLPQIEIMRRESIYLQLEYIVRRIRGLLWTMATHSLSMQCPAPQRPLRVKDDENFKSLAPNKGFFWSLLERNKTETSSNCRSLQWDTESSSEAESIDSNEFPQKPADEKEEASGITKEGIKGELNVENQNSTEVCLFNKFTGITRERESDEGCLLPPLSEITPEARGSEPIKDENEELVQKDDDDNDGEEEDGDCSGVDDDDGEEEDGDCSGVDDDDGEEEDGDCSGDDDDDFAAVDGVDEELSSAVTLETKMHFKVTLQDEKEEDLGEDNPQNEEEDEQDKRKDEFILQEGDDTSLVNRESGIELECSPEDDTEEYFDEVEKEDMYLKNKAASYKKSNLRFHKIENSYIIPTLTWYIRENRELCGLKLGEDRLINYENFPSLFEVDRLTLSERKKVFCRIADLDLQFEDVPLNIEFIFFCIVFWRINYEPHVNDATFLSVVMCVLMFTVIDGKLGRKRSRSNFYTWESSSEKVEALTKSGKYSDPSTLSIAALIEDLTSDECQLANLSLLQFHLIKTLDCQKYFRSAVHAYSAYQACIHFLQCINSLVCFPFPVVTPDSFWSGTFCYNVRKCFSSDMDLCIILSSIFDHNNRIIHLFFKMYNLLQVPLKLPSVKQTIPSIITKDVKEKVGVLSPSKLGIVKSKESPFIFSGLEDPSPEFDVIENPTEEERRLMAGNKFSALLLK